MKMDKEFNTLEKIEKEFSQETKTNEENGISQDREMQRAHRVKKAKRTRKRNVTIIAVLTSLILVACGVTMVQMLNEKKSQELVEEVPSIPEVEEEVIVEEEDETVTINITAVGDCTLGTDTAYGTWGSFMEMYDAQGGAYFFSQVKSIFEEDDITLINVEGPLTDNESQRADKQFAFRGEPEYVDIMSSSSVEAANLANNHSKDYGTIGYQDTIDNIEGAGVATFGYDRIAYFEVKGIKVALVGVYALALGVGAKDEVIARVTEAKDNGAQLIITSFHWGVELAKTPESYQTVLAEAAIDSGSDVVLGHHPHTIQGMDEYNGKYIFYSLANFSFGGNRNPTDKDTLIYQQSFTFTNNELVDTSVNLIPASVSSISSKNNYQPIVVSGSEKTRIADKIKERSMIDVSGFIS